MPEHGHQRQVQGGVSYAGVWSEDGKDTSQGASDKQRLLVQADCQARHVRGGMKPENAQKELAEGVEHFDEEIPPETHVGRQVRQQKTYAVRGSEKVP